MSFSQLKIFTQKMVGVKSKPKIIITWGKHSVLKMLAATKMLKFQP
jgi:hypothetical protein